MNLRRFVWVVVPIMAVPMLVVAAGPAVAAGATRYVATSGSDVDNASDVNDCQDPSHPCLTIQHAVDEAERGDTVSVAAGGYAESLSVPLSLTLTGAGAGKTTVSGDGSDPAITVDGLDAEIPPTVTISNLAASGNTADDGVYATEATVVLTDVAASQNAGAGVESSASTVHINNSALDENQDGGVVDDSGTVGVKNTTVDANIGVGVVANGAGTTVTVTGSTITHTTPFTTSSSALGGGVAVYPGGSATVSESTVDANTNFGMAVFNGVGRIRNSTVSGTKVSPAEQFQGGLFYSASSSNTSARSRPSAVADTAAAGLTATATIDADNAVTDCAGTIGDGGYNLDSDGSCHLSATGSHAHAKADLRKLANNGGPTETLLPGFGSAARNAIPFGSAGCATGAKDQRGHPRRSPAAGKCDIGSVEAAVVNPTVQDTIAATHRSHGWYRGRVTVTYTCKIGTAPLTHACPTPTTFTSSGRNHHVTKTITAVDGGSATVTIKGIKIDNTKPRITITGVKNGDTYPSVRQIHRKCQDFLSGIATCQLRTHRHRSRVNYVVIARDNAGNVHRRRGKYFLGD